jgi:hypothetical protein
VAYNRAAAAGGVSNVVLSQYAGRDPLPGRSPSATPIHRADQSASASRPASSPTGALHSLPPRSVHTLTRAMTERRERSKTGTRTNDWAWLSTRPVSKPSSVRSR